MSRRRTSDLITKILTGQKVNTIPTPLTPALVALATPHTDLTPSSPSNKSNSGGFGSLLNPINLDMGKYFTANNVAPPVIGGSKHPHKLNLAAQAAIAAQYDPAINALNSEIGVTQNQAARSRRQIRRQGNRAVGDLTVLYGNLDRDVRQTKRREDRGYRHDIRNTRQSYRDMQNEVNNNYSTSMGSTAKELQRLGIDPATALAGAAHDQAFLNSQDAIDRRRAVGNQRESRRSFNNLMNQVREDTVASGLAQIGQSKTATRTALANLANTLADNLFKLRSQQATIQGQEAAARANAHMNVLAMRNKMKGDKLDRQYKKAEIAKLLGLGPAGTTNGLRDPYATTGVGKGLAFLNTNIDKVQHPVALANILQYVTGGAGPGQTIPWDKHNYGQIWNAMVKTGKRHGWTQADMNYLQRALEISLGLG